jgi:hypothetical protein
VKALLYLVIELTGLLLTGCAFAVLCVLVSYGTESRRLRRTLRQDIDAFEAGVPMPGVEVEP